MGLADVIARFGTGTYQVTRPAIGTWVDGHYVNEGAPSTFPIDASVQPMSGRDLRDLPEGMHAEDVRRLWTRTELRTASTQIGASSSNASSEPDVVSIDGEDYRVVRVEHFAILDDFYRVLVARLGAP